MATAAQVNERLASLTEAGTSVWLDQIRRSLIESGELQRLVEEDSLRGVTSNPAIFEKAILGSDDYDEDIERLAGEGLDATAIYHGGYTDTVSPTGKKSREILAQLEVLGISYADLAQRLEDEGVQKFVDSWQELLASVDKKLSA